MKRVTGIGGIFFNSKDPDALRAWYKKHLGIDVQEWGGTAFTWTDSAGSPYKGTTTWTIGAAPAAVSLSRPAFSPGPARSGRRLRRSW